jgi:hypothetical protein
VDSLAPIDPCLGTRQPNPHQRPSWSRAGPIEANPRFQYDPTAPPAAAGEPSKATGVLTSRRVVPYRYWVADLVSLTTTTGHQSQTRRAMNVGGFCMGRSQMARPPQEITNKNLLCSFLNRFPQLLGAV